MGSVGDSCTVRAFGSDVREVEDARDWSRCRYNMTVPSPRPIARWATVVERATVVTYGGGRLIMQH